jgi:phage-related protein
VANKKIDKYNEYVISLKTLEIIVIKQAQRELKNAPKDVLSDVFALFDDLADGKKLGMPISRPLPSVGKGLHELRLSGRAGEYRVFYVIKVGDAIYIIHSATKKKQTLDRQTIELLRQRMRSLEL